MLLLPEGDPPASTRVECCVRLQLASFPFEVASNEIPQLPRPSVAYIHRLKVKELFSHIEVCPDAGGVASKTRRGCTCSSGGTELIQRWPLFTSWDAPGAPKPNEALFVSWDQPRRAAVLDRQSSVESTNIVRERVLRASKSNALRRGNTDMMQNLQLSRESHSSVEEDPALNPDLKVDPSASSRQLDDPSLPKSVSRPTLNGGRQHISFGLEVPGSEAS